MRGCRSASVDLKPYGLFEFDYEYESDYGFSKHNMRTEKI